MKFAKTGTLSLSLKSRPLRQERTVHEILSDLQRAYSVFVPASDDFFNLFQLIHLHPDRPRSPRNTNANLREVVTRLAHMTELGYDANFVDAFREQFEKVQYREISQPPTVFTASDESLRGAGLTIATPGPHVGINASRSRTTQRQLRLSKLSSGVYTGGTALRRLIWEHAEPLFLLLLEELDNEVSQVGGRNLLGVTTKRLISNVGVSRTDRQDASAMVSIEHGVSAQVGGARSRMSYEEYDDLYGVSGLHFILFPVECRGWHQWRVYRGIDVCDSELDENDSPDALRRNVLYQARLWLQGTGNLDYATRDGYKSVRNDERMDSTKDTRSAGTGNERRRDDLGHIDVIGACRTAPFVNIDARPFLSRFAMNQCRLAATYRKTSTNNSDMAFQAVCLLRGVLRKGLFESMIRALYDLSGCYLNGLGVKEDKSMARLLRYCASGLRRSYSTRSSWSKRFAIEIGFRRDQEPEQRLRMICMLSRRSLVSLDYNDGESILPRPLHSTKAFRNGRLDEKGDVRENDKMEVCFAEFNPLQALRSLFNDLPNLSDKETMRSQSAVSKRKGLHGRDEREIKRVKRETMKEEGEAQLLPSTPFTLPIDEGALSSPIQMPRDLTEKLGAIRKYVVKMSRTWSRNLELERKAIRLATFDGRTQLPEEQSSKLETLRNLIENNIKIEREAIENTTRFEKIVRKAEEILEAAASTQRVSAAQSIQNARKVRDMIVGLQFREKYHTKLGSNDGHDDASNARKYEKRLRLNRQSAAASRVRRRAYAEALEAELVQMEKAHDALLTNLHIVSERKGLHKVLQDEDHPPEDAARHQNGDPTKVEAAHSNPRRTPIHAPSKSHATSRDRPAS